MKNQKYLPEMFLRRLRDIFSEICSRRLKDVTQNTSFLRCLKDVTKKTSPLRCFWEVSEISLSMEIWLKSLRDIYSCRLGVLRCGRDTDRKKRNIRTNTGEEWEEVVQIYKERKRKREERREKVEEESFRFGCLVQP